MRVKSDDSCECVCVFVKETEIPDKSLCRQERIDLPRRGGTVQAIC